jgi:hypothetical protein
VLSIVKRMSEFASSNASAAASGAAAATGGAAEAGDWKEACVRPPKDTRVQTAVSAVMTTTFLRRPDLRCVC